MLRAPPVITTTLSLAIGRFASAPFSPLEWAILIAEPKSYQP